MGIKRTRIEDQSLVGQDLGIRPPCCVGILLETYYFDMGCQCLFVENVEKKKKKKKKKRSFIMWCPKKKKNEILPLQTTQIGRAHV